MRRRTAKKHIILPDPKYKDVEVTKFVNSLMIDGKKNIKILKQNKEFINKNTTRRLPWGAYKFTLAAPKCCYLI